MAKFAARKKCSPKWIVLVKAAGPGKEIKGKGRNVGGDPKYGLPRTGETASPNRARAAALALVPPARKSPSEE